MDSKPQRVSLLDLDGHCYGEVTIEGPTYSRVKETVINYAPVDLARAPRQICHYTRIVYRDSGFTTSTGQPVWTPEGAPPEVLPTWLYRPDPRRMRLRVTVSRAGQQHLGDLERIFPKIAEPRLRRDYVAAYPDVRREDLTFTEWTIWTHDLVATAEDITYTVTARPLLRVGQDNALEVGEAF